MSIGQFVRILRTQWLFVASMTILSALGAAAYAWSQTPIYGASATLVVSPQIVSEDLSQLAQGSNFSLAQVKTYAAIVPSHEVLQPVIDELHLPWTSSQLATRVTATNPLDTELIYVRVVDASPQRASDVANAVAHQFKYYVATQLSPSSRQGISPVSIEIPQPAVIPQQADSPRKPLDLGIGILLGLAVGIGAAALRVSLDRTIGGRNEVGAIAMAPVLAAIGDDPLVKEAPLIVHNAFSPRAEAFRQLRTNIRFLSIDHQVKSLVVSSSVEGEGKTTTACNLAIALAQNGEKVVLIDADLRRPTMGTLFGIPAGIGLTSVLLGDVPLDAALQLWRSDLPLFLLASGPTPPNPSELIGSRSMADVIAELTEQGYAVVVDSPPLLPVTDAAILARITGGALIVARVGSTRTDQLAHAVENLTAAGAPILGVVLNRVPAKGRGGYYGQYGYHSGPIKGYAPRSSVSSESIDLAGSSPRTAGTLVEG